MITPSGSFPAPWPAGRPHLSASSTAAKEPIAAIGLEPGNAHARWHLKPLQRLLHVHEIALKEARTMARRAAEGGDDGTNDLLVSDVIRRNELQVWFVAEHVVDVH
jgi:DNA-binding ferritin-like protein